MHAIKTLLTLSALALSASSYVLNHGHSLERDVVVPRRHAHHGVNLAARAPVANSSVSSPVFTRAHRRSMRQKRCLSQGSSSTNNDNNNSQPTTTDSNPPATTSGGNSNSNGNSGNNNGGNTGGSGSSGSSGGSGSGSGSGSADTYTGQLTFYDVGLGACGGYNTDSDMIAAASMLLYDGFNGYNGGNPNNNPICNKQAAITYQGKTITVTIVDRCVGCAMYDLDLSPTAFSQLADQSQGRLDGATWHFL